MNIVSMQTGDSTARTQRTVRRALLDGAQFLRDAGIESARLDAEVLLGYVLNAERTDIYLGMESTCNDNDEKGFRELLMRRAKGEPIAYITGRKEFWSLDFVVTPDVLIPRPETELLVELSLENAMIAPARDSLKIFDIGTGSGVIAVTLAKELRAARIWAVDASATALNVAVVNARRHGVADRIQFLHGDLFDPIADLGHSFDLIVSNPPYVSSQGIPKLARYIRDWEPKMALDGGPDGLDCYRRIVDRAHKYLAPEGRVLLEIGEDQSKALAELFARVGGFEAATIYQDYAGKDRVIATSKITRLDSKSFSRG
ncbi:MAG TPA: peptide chain release factor N(5)-glutamine methyltransferase [Candidatus Acidoferrales bacterium]|nr:peptide chain release factor N(5)-glutamine methyltransferase [Candidatus Acidoferrales bacterium]